MTTFEDTRGAGLLDESSGEDQFAGLTMAEIAESGDLVWGFLLEKREDFWSYSTAGIEGYVWDEELVGVLYAAMNRVHQRVNGAWGDGGHLSRVDADPGLLGPEVSGDERRPCRDVFGPLEFDPDGKPLWMMLLAKASSGRWYWRDSGPSISSEELLGALITQSDRLRRRVLDAWLAEVADDDECRD